MSVRDLVPSGAAVARDDDLAGRIARSARCGSIAAVERWLEESADVASVDVRRVPLGDLENWRFERETGDLVHGSGRFFAVRGMQVRALGAANLGGPVREWWQPILYQPEVGILGFVVRDVGGVLHFLAQVKVEPGNVVPVQIAPTVQATPSNYTLAHHGSHVPLLEYFVEPWRGRLLVDVQQSEQGSWFYGKRNRNMIVEVAGEVDHPGGFEWLTLGQIHAMMHRPNVVNMSTRTVLSCLPLPDPTGGGIACDGEREESLAVDRWISACAQRGALAAELVPLRRMDGGWEHRAGEIRRRDGKFFSIVGVSVVAKRREVRHWCQPLLAPSGPGLAAFVVRRRASALELLVHADVRPGYWDRLELGPTVQCTPRNFDDGLPRPELLDLVLSGDLAVRYDVDQSEEGGRFERAVTRHMVVELPDGGAVPCPPAYRWLTAAEVWRRMRARQLNIEARSLLTCLQALRCAPHPAGDVARGRAFAPHRHLEDLKNM